MKISFILENRKKLEVCLKIVGIYEDRSFLNFDKRYKIIVATDHKQ